MRRTPVKLADIDLMVDRSVGRGCTPRAVRPPSGCQAPVFRHPWPESEAQFSPSGASRSMRT